MAEPASPQLIPYRLRSGEVIQLYVDHISLAVRNLETALRGQLCKQHGEGHRISAAGKPDDNPRPRLQEAVPADEVPNAVDEREHGLTPVHGQATAVRSLRGEEAGGGLPYGRPACQRKWCRCRDLNPGLRGYEPRALTI